jgi:hypothetical protein
LGLDWSENASLRELQENLKREQHEEHLQREQVKVEEARCLRKLRYQHLWQSTGKPAAIGVGIVLVLTLPLLVLAVRLANK